MSEFWMNLHEIAERKIEEYHAERRRAARHPHFYSRGSYHQDTWPKRPIKVPAGLDRKLAAIQAEFRDQSPETMARRRKDREDRITKTMKALEKYQKAREKVNGGVEIL